MRSDPNEADGGRRSVQISPFSACAVFGDEGMPLKAYGFSEEEPYAFFVCPGGMASWSDTLHQLLLFIDYKEVVLMACFLVPVAEAVVATVITKAVEAKETEAAQRKADTGNNNFETKSQIPLASKLKWLTSMLWGGSALLAFEHLWHGEVVPWFPFLTAASDPAAAAEMLAEMATVGVAMAVLVTTVWGVMLLVTKAMEKKALQTQPISD